jgi:two-component system, NtrC family, response regulator
MTEMSVSTEASVTSEPILLVEDDAGLQRQMRWALEPHIATIAGARAQAVQKFTAAGPFRIVLLDLGLPPDQDGASEGLKTLEAILALKSQTKVIVLSGNSDRANAVKAVSMGAFDFIAKPADTDILKIIIARAVRMYQLEDENLVLKARAGSGIPGMIFGSSQMSHVARMIERVGQSDASVLILGESGTGKEVVARSLHEASPRRAGKSVAINCASIPENLLESELFGHERGAFTGAVKQTIGKFELANNGTIFLDEIGDMPLALQAKLLRFLQERQFERVGGRASIKVNVRVISATNKDIGKLAKEGAFREDLFYRLNEVCIQLPPLREREGDTLLLARHFLDIFGRANSRNLRGFSDDAVAAMANYPWPGNVRELESRIKRAVIMVDGPIVTAKDLELETAEPSEERSLNLRKQTERLERMLLQEALTVSQGNISKAAKLLGISRPHLYNLKKLHGQD